MATHLVDGEFQSDKYPTCPRGKVPLSVRDASAQDLLWTYAQRRRAVDVEFSADLEAALLTAGYQQRCSDLAVAQAQLAVVRAWIERERALQTAYPNPWVKLAAAMDEAAEKVRRGT